MKVDADLVRHIAGLANLQLSDAEISYYEKQLANIIGYVAQLDELKLSSEQSYAPDAATPERQDTVVSSLDVERVMAQAPQKIGTAFQVPRILD